jgi:hypothetical protein
MKKALTILLIYLFGNYSYSQNKGTLELTLTLRDGNIITGTTQKINSVVLITPYGKLDVPIKNVSSIVIGIDADKTNSEKIKNLCKQLNNSAEEMRKNAFEELVKMPIGAIPVIDEFILSASNQPTDYSDYTIESALSDLKASHGINENASSDDIISIDYLYTIGGKYEFKDIELKTEYGTLTIPKSKIEKIDVMYLSETNGLKTFKLLASKHISSNNSGGWLKTGINIKAGQTLNLSASGEITFASLSGNKYKANGTVVGSATDEEYEDYNYEGSNSNYPTYGNVVFKIGETGQVMKAGDKFNGTVKTSGQLYISIYETVYNATNTGSYVVNISVK